jgi:cysteine desulfurase
MRSDPLYLDCNASNPVDERVLESMFVASREFYGNAGSPHRHGERAKSAVHQARDSIGRVVGVKRHEVVFTSGATESNNISISGLVAHGKRSGKKHVVSSAIEHKAVLEPLDRMRSDGFEISLVEPNSQGVVQAEEIERLLRPDTLLVSLMHVNNETGVVQPVSQVASMAQDRGVLMHVDAAQGFGREWTSLAHPGITMISISGHKIFGPQGIGALIVRRTRNELPPLEPLSVGGGQELGLRSGTLPVPLIVGLGTAAQLALEHHRERDEHCLVIRRRMLEWVHQHRGVIHGCQESTLPHVINVSFPGWEADELIEALSPWVSISNGAACTSVCATASHVLQAMGVRGGQLDGAVRWSWSHMTDRVALAEALDGAGSVIDLKSGTQAGASTDQ